jgi:hypothetical protein
MQISNSKFHRVWSIEIDQNGNKKIDIGDSKKQQDGTYFNWTWKWCRLVGNAKGIQVDEGDTITINSGKLDQYKDNNGNYRNSVTIFDFEVTAKGNQQNNNQQGTGTTSKSYQSYNQNNGGGNDFSKDIPF